MGRMDVRDAAASRRMTSTSRGHLLRGVLVAAAMVLVWALGLGCEATAAPAQPTPVEWVTPLPARAVPPSAERDTDLAVPAAGSASADADTGLAVPPAGGEAPAPAVQADSIPVAAPPRSEPPRKRGLVGDLGHVVKVFGSDFWYVVSSPTRMNREGFLWAVGVAGIEAALYANDQQIMDASQRNRQQAPFRQAMDAADWLEPIGFMGTTNAYYFGAFLIGYATQLKSVEQISSQVLESHFIAGGIRNVLKPLAGRLHPYENQGARTFDFGKGSSFPSGHTSVLFEDATILSMHAHWWPVTVAAYGVATVCATQRVTSRNHWPSDVFFPAVTGTWIARTVVHRHEGRSMDLRPSIESRDGMPSVVLEKKF